MHGRMKRRQAATLTGITAEGCSNDSRNDAACVRQQHSNTSKGRPTNWGRSCRLAGQRESHAGEPCLLDATARCLLRFGRKDILISHGTSSGITRPTLRRTLLIQMPSQPAGAGTELLDDTVVGDGLCGIQENGGRRDMRRSRGIRVGTRLPLLRGGSPKPSDGQAFFLPSRRARFAGKLTSRPG